MATLTETAAAGTLLPEGTLPEATWADFGARYWEEEACVLPDSLPGPLFPPENLLTALVRSSDLYRAGEPVEFVFFRDGKPVPPGFGALLPDSMDRSLEEYVDRVERRIGGEFTVLLANPHLYDRDLWCRARRMLRGLFRQVGIPCGGVDTGIFMGRYSKTPFGVHRGQMSVMTFPTEGVKHFRLWRRGYGEAHPEIVDKLEYPEHLDASFELSARPVDILYWPADVWHIAEATREHTAACNVGFWWDRPPLVRALLELSEQLAGMVGMDDPRGTTFPVGGPVNGPVRGGASTPSSPVAEAVEQIRRAATGEEIERALALDWLRLLSGDGFRDVPAPAPEGSVTLDDGDAVSREPDAQILWAEAGGGELHFAAEGHAFVLQDTPPLRALAERLAAGEPVRVGEAPEEARDLLATLALLRAVVKET